MGSFINHTGKRYGRLTAIEFAYIDHTGRACWKFRCDCGNEKTMPAINASRGQSKSCGCYHKEIVRKNGFKHGDSNGKGRHSRLYRILNGMKNRCENSNHKAFLNYGGRGITICPEWHDYEVFKKWALEVGYKEGLTIDKKDNDGNYEPSNCQWITLADNLRKANPIDNLRKAKVAC